MTYLSLDKNEYSALEIGSYIMGVDSENSIIETDTNNDPYFQTSNTLCVAGHQEKILGSSSSGFLVGCAIIAESNSTKNQENTNNTISSSNNDSQTAKGQTVTLVSSSFSGTNLRASFRIDNNSGKEITMSSILNWSAKDASGKKLEIDWTCADLNGTLLNGDFIKGDICFNGVTEQPVKIYYQTELIGGETLVFTIGNGNTNQTKNTKNDNDNKYTQSADGRDVTLEKATISGKTIRATFRIDNNSGNTINMSSLLDWSAKDASGKKLNLDWTCADFNGTLLAGDFIVGDICFEGITEMPVKLYYSTSIWGGQTLVFTIKK